MSTEDSSQYPSEDVTEPIQLYSLLHDIKDLTPDVFEHEHWDVERFYGTLSKFRQEVARRGISVKNTGSFKKSSNTTGEERFVKLTNSALEDNNLSHFEFRLLGMLIQFARQKGYCWPSVETLAKKMPGRYAGRDRVSTRQIERGLKQLRDLGYITSLSPAESHQKGIDTRDKKGRYADSNTIIILTK